MSAADLVANMWTFLALTLVIGGAGAFVTGRAMALTWRSQWLGLAYMVPLAGAVRFLHYALFQEPTTVPQAILCLVVLGLAVMGGFAVARHNQMRRQYPWVGNT